VSSRTAGDLRIEVASGRRVGTPGRQPAMDCTLYVFSCVAGRSKLVRIPWRSPQHWTNRAIAKATKEPLVFDSAVNVVESLGWARFPLPSSGRHLHRPQVRWHSVPPGQRRR
jgi:hypothetical protein